MCRAGRRSHAVSRLVKFDTIVLIRVYFYLFQSDRKVPGLIAVTFGTIRHESESNSESESHMSDGSSMNNESVKV